MVYKYTYPVVDRALRNFLVFVLMLVVVVVVAAVIGASFVIIDLPMFYDDYEPEALLYFDRSEHQPGQEFTGTG